MEVIHISDYVYPLMAAGAVGLVIGFFVWVSLTVRNYREQRIKTLIDYGVRKFACELGMWLYVHDEELKDNFRKKETHAAEFMSMAEPGEAVFVPDGMHILSPEEKSNLATLGQKVKEGMAPYVPLHKRPRKPKVHNQ
jgi:hypothetical protein